MPGILVPAVEQYLNRLLPQRDPVLAEMERYAARHGVPIIGPACGRVLFQLARMARAKRIFEMGSAIGYSAIWWARAAGPGGEVFYTDSDPENARLARTYFRRAGVEKRVHIRLGDALGILDATPGQFDLIFLDMDKKQYPEGLLKAVRRLRRGGLLVADNVLWQGKVAHASRDAITRPIQRFNGALYTSRRLFPVIIPLRDGLAVAIRR